MDKVMRELREKKLKLLRNLRDDKLRSFKNKFVIPFTEDFYNDELEESHYISEATFDDAQGLIIFITSNFNSELNQIVIQSINRLHKKRIYENSDEALDEFREILIDILYLQIDTGRGNE